MQTKHVSELGADLGNRGERQLARRIESNGQPRSALPDLDIHYLGTGAEGQVPGRGDFLEAMRC